MSGNQLSKRFRDVVYPVVIGVSLLQVLNFNSKVKLPLVSVVVCVSLTLAALVYYFKSIRQNQDHPISKLGSLTQIMDKKATELVLENLSFVIKNLSEVRNGTFNSGSSVDLANQSSIPSNPEEQQISQNSTEKNQIIVDAPVLDRTIQLLEQIRKTITESSSKKGQRQLIIALAFPDHADNCFRERFKKRIKDWIKSVNKDVTVEFETEQNAQALLPGRPLIIVCFAESRLEADIDQSLRNFDLRLHRIAVIILHYGIERNLPRLPASLKVTEKKYEQINLIDATYDQRLDKCELNKKAKSDLDDFLKQFC